MNERKNVKRFVTVLLLFGVFICGCGFSFNTYARYFTISDSTYDEVTIYVSESTQKYLVNDNDHIVNELSTSQVTGVTEINGTEYTVYFPFASDPYIRVYSSNYNYTEHYFNDYELISTNIDFDSNVPNINFDYVTLCLIGGVFVCVFYSTVKQ